jgi:predicted nucleotidyltransferase
VSVYEPIFKILNEAGVRYVVVGGVATLLHGYARLTADVDLAVDLAPQEVRKMIRALANKGFRPQVPVSAETFADPAVREQWIREKHMRAFSLVDLRNPMRVVDLLLKSEVPFEELLARSQEAFVGETSVRVASLDDLITLKRHAGRPQDLADVKELEAIRNRKKDRQHGG